jgi:hypothetical protein
MRNLTNSDYKLRILKNFEIFATHNISLEHFMSSITLTASNVGLPLLEDDDSTGEEGVKRGAKKRFQWFL